MLEINGLFSIPIANLMWHCFNPWKYQQNGQGTTTVAKYTQSSQETSIQSVREALFIPKIPLPTPVQMCNSLLNHGSEIEGLTQLFNPDYIPFKTMYTTNIALSNKGLEVSQTTVDTVWM